MPFIENEKVYRKRINFMERLNYSAHFIWILQLFIFLPLGLSALLNDGESYSHLGIMIFILMFLFASALSLYSIKNLPKAKDYWIYKITDKSIEYCSPLGDTQRILLDKVDRAYQVKIWSKTFWIFSSGHEKFKFVDINDSEIQKALKEKRIKIVDLSIHYWVWVLSLCFWCVYIEKSLESNDIFYLGLGVWTLPFLYFKNGMKNGNSPNQMKFVKFQVLPILGSSLLMMIGTPSVLDTHSKIDQNNHYSMRLIRSGQWLKAINLLDVTNQLGEFAPTLNSEAWILTTIPEVSKRDYQKAEQLAERAMENVSKMSWSQNKYESIIADTLACTKIALGKKEEALEIAKKYYLKNRLDEFQESKLCQDSRYQTGRLPAGIGKSI